MINRFMGSSFVVDSGGQLRIIPMRLVDILLCEAIKVITPMNNSDLLKRTRRTLPTGMCLSTRCVLLDPGSPVQYRTLSPTVAIENSP